LVKELTIMEIKRLYYLDALRFMATIAVIVLHVAAAIDSLVYSQNEWIASNIFVSLTRWCVPVFIMLSGILLLDTTKEYSNKVFFSKRLSKIALPFIGWSLLYQVRFYRDEIIQTKSFPIVKMLTGIIEGPVSVHLWFIYLLIVLYLIIPIIKEYIKNKSMDELKNIIIVWFIINSFDYFCIFCLGINSGLHGYLITLLYSGYLVFGYYIATYPVQITNKVLVVMLFAIILITIAGNHFVKYNQILSEGAFNDFLSPNIIIMSGLIVTLVKNNCFLSEKPINKIQGLYRALLAYFTKISYGIYLVHLVILSILSTQLKSNALFLYGHHVSPYLAIPVTSIMILFMCVLIIGVLEKIPYLRRLLV
jgi:surface polysaccharide O-acyltransferase-like enzyme